MQDSKATTWASDPDAGDKQEASADDQEAAVGGENQPADHWQKYRRWISKAPAPRSRRSGIDPSLYTWKGYRSWSEQVKRDWSDS